MVDDAGSIIFAEVCKEVGDAYHFDIAQLQRLENYNAYLFHWLNGFGFTAWNDIYTLLNAQSGKQIFSATHVLLKDRNHLILSEKKKVTKESFLIHKQDSQVNIPLKLTFSKTEAQSGSSNSVIFVDEEKLEFPLLLRRWKQGDVFLPAGMDGQSKKLSKFFKDEKFSLIEKENAWLLCSGNQIVWVIGHRADERFKPTTTTKQIQQICSINVYISM